MRIISGKLKGSSLYMPKNKTTRPLKDIVRESVFNLLKHSNKISFKIEKSHILDLYSGTGSFGLECLSRQAQNVYFVEKEENAIAFLKKNIGKFQLNNKTKIFISDVLKIIEQKKITEKKFDLIFCDPPFENSNINKLIELIENNNLLKKTGIIILHRNKAANDKLPEYFNIVEERIYGISKIIFGKFLT